MMARSSKSPSIGRIQKRKTNLLQIIIFGLQRAAGQYRWAMYGRCPRCKRESDFSAKRSGAAMYTAYCRLEDYLCRDAATVAAGPDVIR